MFTFDTTLRGDIYFAAKTGQSFSICADYEKFQFFDYDVFGNLEITI